jgi:hypothetical protein
VIFALRRFSKGEEDMQRKHFHVVNAALAALLLAGPLGATAAGPGGAQGQGQGLERARDVTEQAQERKEERERIRDASGEGADKAKGKQKGYGEGGRDDERERSREQEKKMEKDQVREQRDGGPAQSGEEQPRKRWWWPFGSIDRSVLKWIDQGPHCCGPFCVGRPDSGPNQRLAG